MIHLPQMFDYSAHCFASPLHCLLMLTIYFAIQIWMHFQSLQLYDKLELKLKLSRLPSVCVYLNSLPSRSILAEDDTRPPCNLNPN